MSVYVWDAENRSTNVYTNLNWILSTITFVHWTKASEIKKKKKDTVFTLKESIGETEK